jgi:hypothetical protein
MGADMLQDRHNAYPILIGRLVFKILNSLFTFLLVIKKLHLSWYLIQLIIEIIVIVVHVENYFFLAISSKSKRETVRDQVCFWFCLTWMKWNIFFKQIS